jgi:hypothetical protein
MQFKLHDSCVRIRHTRRTGSTAESRVSGHRRQARRLPFRHGCGGSRRLRRRLAAGRPGLPGSCLEIFQLQLLRSSGASGGHAREHAVAGGAADPGGAGVVTGQLSATSAKYIAFSRFIRSGRGHPASASNQRVRSSDQSPERPVGAGSGSPVLSADRRAVGAAAVPGCRFETHVARARPVECAYALWRAS